ncbi:hypothetical protein G4359_00815 [Dorea longicatena]|uniref:hypothetical protein n=1 Tax=Dorea longicatena TaxID=88431 RepID=UPI00157025A8|nr:hypothetical protein [Dorea longicatena]NSC48756.1 hypothetical protein [Dorea longicatena]NSD24901.1 hypothetical protein [Dorea longicatena]NSD40520.1 hypothetical protein [Dorea longicatena]NSD69471.1 hypothetical protein [Dorea longicatena]NSD72435.1 hypothetical protein [Dorea longicatena]
MAKIFKVSGYIVDVNGDSNVDEVIAEVSPGFDGMINQHIHVEEADIGKWNDEKAIIYIEKPDGKKVKINRYFKESEESFKEISWLEYQIRRYKDWRRRKWLGNDEERHS